MNVLDNKQSEKETMREMFVIKIKQMFEEKAREMTQDEATEQQEKSIDDVDMNKTGEMSKASKEDAVPATGRKSNKQEAKKDENTHDASIDNVSKSGLTANASMKSLIALPDRNNLDSDFKPVIIEIWRELATNYKGQMKRVFRNIRLQREQMSVRNASVKSQFLEFLQTSDGK